MGIFAGKNLESTDTICKIRNSEIIRIITENNKKETKEIDLTHTCDLKTKEGVKTLREHIAKLTDKTISKECLELQSVDVGFPIPFLKVIHILPIESIILFFLIQQCLCTAFLFLYKTVLVLF